MDAPSALACLAAARRAAQHPNARWPGWDFDAHPVGLALPEGLLLWGHPSPPPGFAPLPLPVGGDAPPGPLHLGPVPDGLANSTLDLGGRRVATARLADTAPGPGAVRLIVHEAFHAFQAQVRPDAGVPSQQTADYPEEDAANNALARAENACLAAFLEGTRGAAECARDLTALRAVRYACLDPAWPAYEAAAEWCEGGAQLAEALVSGPGERPAWAAALRRLNRAGEGAAYRRFYASGAAIGLLLAELLPGWRARWLAPGATPTGLLQAAGGEPRDAAAVLGDYGVADLLAEEAAATAARRREIEGLLAQWVPALVVEVAAAPPTSFGFDPTRRRVLSGGRQLHGGWTRLAGPGWVFDVPEGPVLEDRRAGTLTLPLPAGLCLDPGRRALALPLLRAEAARVARGEAGGWRIVIEREAR